MVAPPNNVRNLDLVFEHYRRAAEAVSLPVVVQDEPVNTGVVMPSLATLTFSGGFVPQDAQTPHFCSAL
jgi:dihydrodipicolinate synthase/N-acetylneuraminate lyase